MAGFLFYLVAQQKAIAVDLVKRPLEFYDLSETEIKSYCLVPLYGKSYGIGLGAESSGRKSRLDRYLMWPVCMNEDYGFDKIRRVRQKGFLFIFMPIEYGESTYIDKILFIKHGYKPLLWDSYIDSAKSKKIYMEKGDSESVLHTLTSQNPDQNKLREIFDINYDTTIVNEYTDLDRDLLIKCYYGETGRP